MSNGNQDARFREALDLGAADAPLAREHLLAMLACEGEDETRRLFATAYAIKTAYVGRTVYFRGLIEFSNICVKNCLYCGVRRGNPDVPRYRMSREDILRAALWAHDNRYGSVVLQSGERQDPEFTAFVTEVVAAIKKRTRRELGITLSVGEQTLETYRTWFEAGAHRYLLRIETSNPDLYARLHPADHRFEDRLQALRDLRTAGYQVGTGVMIGLPGQTLDDLADDLRFFKTHDIDMLGMGPYIPHRATPLAARMPESADARERRLNLGLRMIAAARIYLRDVNIVAATALQALDPEGREEGLLAGANIVMPNVTDTKYRAAYQLYDDKPCLDETAAAFRDRLRRRIESIGETVGFGEWGDSPHYRRTAENRGPGGGRIRDGARPGARRSP